MTTYISIHASREGSDGDPVLDGDGEPLFQSTLPAREATISAVPALFTDDISIHASREGSDLCKTVPDFTDNYFNPRFPRGKRPYTLSKGKRAAKFQSTLPAREATIFRFFHTQYFNISIHASREGSDNAFAVLKVADLKFQSTLPAREATLACIAR